MLDSMFSVILIDLEKIEMWRSMLWLIVTKFAAPFSISKDLRRLVKMFYLDSHSSPKL